MAHRLYGFLLVVLVLILLFAVLILALPARAQDDPETPSDRIFRFDQSLRFYEDDPQFQMPVVFVRIELDNADSLLSTAATLGHRTFSLVGIEPIGARVPVWTVRGRSVSPVDSLYPWWQFTFQESPGEPSADAGGRDTVWANAVVGPLRDLETTFERLRDGRSGGPDTGPGPLLLDSAVESTLRLHTEVQLAALLVRIDRTPSGHGSIAVDYTALPVLLELLPRYGIATPDLPGGSGHTTSAR